MSNTTTTPADVHARARRPCRPRRRRRRRRIARARRVVVGTALLIAAALALLVVGPRFLPFQTLYVRSGSMRPTLPVGSLVAYRPAAASQLRVGDVVVFRRPSGAGAGELVTHRVVRVEQGAHGRQLVTQGDANRAPDPWRVPATGRGWRLWFAVPVLGYVVGALQSPLGHTWLLSAFAVVAGLLLLVELWRPRPGVAPAT